MKSNARSAVLTVVLATLLIAAAAMPSAQTPVPIVAQNPTVQTQPPAAQTPAGTTGAMPNAIPDPINTVAAAPTVRKIQLTFNPNGTVTLVAQNASARDILNEWARLGGCKFVNVEKMMGGAIPVLEFDNQPEAVVLDSLLRSTAGYIIGPKIAGTPGPSQFGAVYIVAQSTGTKPAFSNASPVAAPLMSQPDDEIPPVTPPQLSQPAATTPAPAPAAPKQPGVYVPMIGTTTPPPGGTGRGGGGGAPR